MISKPLGTSSVTIEVLTPIWQRVLQRSSIGVDDNFFDLGGDSPLANQLFREVAQACGRELAPVLICQVPTIASLAALLSQPAPPRISSPVPLKAGIGSPPIFIAHGLGDTVMGVVQLARHIQFPRPVFGLQARGVDGAATPLESIEEMARFHVEAIRRLQPGGPYFLVGYSLGGLVALEIARLLSENGEQIALLTMLDSYPHIRHLPTGERARLTLRLARRRFAKALQSFRHEGRPPVVNDPLVSASAVTMQQMRESDEVAWRRYQPRFYRGRIRFVRAAISSYFPDNPVAVWARLAEEFGFETIPGDHMEMLTTHSAGLATVISGYLREVSSEGRG